MANRYWIGGAGNWNDVTHWSDSSGGVGGASVPTSSDNVFFDNNSGTGTITVNAIASMLDFDVTGLAQNITLANAAYTFNVYGNFKLSNYLLTSFTSTGYLYLKSTTSVGIWANGTTKNWNRIYFDGVGGTWTNQDNWNVNATDIYLQNGTWNTNDKTITVNPGWWISLSSTGVRTLNLGNSTLNCGSFDAGVYGTVVLNAGTSTINTTITVAGGGLYTRGRILYNCTCYAYAITSDYGTSTFNNLTIYYSNQVQNLGGDVVINNNLTINGTNSNTSRLLIASNTIGTPRTITCNGTIIASNVDFRDINLAGTANRDLSNITGGSGDCGGNSGIIFTPSQTLYFKHTSGAVNLSDSSKWFTTDGGSTLGRTPLPQDYAYFTANSFAGTSTITFNMPRFCGFDMSGVNQAVTLSQNMAIAFYGDYILGNNIITSLVYPSQISLFGKSGVESKFNSYAKSLGASYINIYRNIYRNYSDINMGTANTSQFRMGNAVFYLNGYNLSCYTFQQIDLTSNFGGYFYAGSGTITINGSSFDIYRVRFFAETSTIVMNSSATSDVSIGSNWNSLVTINKLILQGTITGNYIISQSFGSTTINELTINAGKKVKFEGGRTFSVGKITAKGTNTNKITIGSTTTTKANITYTGGIQPDIKFADISYITATNPFKVRASTDSGNNTNITFNSAKFWVGGTGNINDTVHWSNTSGGAGGAVLPTLNDDVFFDENSLGSDGQTITINTAFDCLSLDFDYLVNTMTLTNAVYNVNVYGGLFLSTKLSTNFTSTGYLYLKSTTSVGIWANGTTKNWNRIYFDGVGGTWTNQDDWNAVSTVIYLKSGIWTTGDKIITISGIAEYSTGIIFTLNFGSSILNINNGLMFATPIPGLTVNAGTSTININGDWCQGGGKTYHTINYTKGTYPNTGVGNFTCSNFYHKNTNTFATIAANFTVTNQLTFEGTNSSNLRTLIASGTVGTPRTITCNGTIVASNVDFRDITGAGTANWDLSSITGGSGDAGGNSGIIFSPAIPQYYKHSGTATCYWKDSTKWFSDQAKTIAGRVPLPQDNATFDATSFDANCTLLVDCPRIGRSLIMELVNQAVTFSLNNDIECYGDFVLGNNITQNGIRTIYFLKREITYIDFKNINLSINYLRFPINTTTYHLQSDINMIAGLAQLVPGGYFYTNGFKINIYTLNNNYTIREFHIENSEINIKDNWYGNSINKIFSYNSVINIMFTQSSKSFYSGNHVGSIEYNIINMIKSGNIQYGIILNELNISAGVTVKFEGGRTYRIRKFTAIGTSSNPITIGSTTTGSTFTLTKTEPLNEKIECDYLILQDSTATPAKTWYAGLNSVNDGNNTGWVFDTFHSRDIIVQPNKRILVDNNGRIVW